MSVSVSIKQHVTKAKYFDILVRLECTDSGQVEGSMPGCLTMASQAAISSMAAMGPCALIPLLLLLPSGHLAHWQGLHKAEGNLYH